jgi:hypothetical protein
MLLPLLKQYLEQEGDVKIDLDIMKQKMELK